MVPIILDHFIIARDQSHFFPFAFPKSLGEGSGKLTSEVGISEKISCFFSICYNNSKLPRKSRTGEILFSEQYLMNVGFAPRNGGVRKENKPWLATGHPG